MKKNVICIMMVLNLIFLPCYQAYADAGTLTVAGGTMSIGGLSAGALAGLAGPAVVAVFCGMLAVGVDIELTQASEQAGMTKTEFLKSKINEYCQEAGTTANIFYKGITDSMSVTKDGAIELGDQASLQLKQFINWLYNNNMVQDTTNQGTGSGQVSIDGTNFPLVPANTVIKCKNDNFKFNQDVAIVHLTGYDEGYLFFNRTGISGSWGYGGKYYWTISAQDGWNNGYAYYSYRTSDLDSNIANVPDFNLSRYNFLMGLDGSFDISQNPVNDGFTGDRDEWNEKSGVLDPSQGLPTTINPGLIGQIPIPADTDITTNVRDYLDALQDVLDGIQDRIIQGVDTADGIPKDLDIPDSVAIDPTIDKDPPVPDDEKTPVTNDDPVNPDQTPNVAMEPLKFDLRNIFPFCIPFDIKDLISLLEEEPEAPRYTVDWVVPIVNTHLTFTVDLEPWNDVAVICRRMELILFAFGLMLATRKLIGS